MNPYIALSTAVLSDYRLIDPELFTTYVRGLLYSKVHQTDGFIPADAIALVTLGVTRDVTLLVTKLVTSGLWIECENGYTVGFERWAKWQDTKDVDDNRRALARERQRKKREADAAKLAQIEDTANGNQPSRSSRVSHDHVTRESRPNRREEEYSLITTPTPSKKPKTARDPARTWRVIAKEWSELDPSKAESIETWCRYKAERKDQPFLPVTVNTKAARYLAWSAKRFEEGVLFSIQKPYQDIFDDPKNDPARQNGKASSNGTHHSPATITVEQAQAMLTGEGLEDRGSPIQRRKPAEGQN